MKLILKSLLLASAFVLPSAFGADTPLAQDTTASPQDAVEVHAPLSLERLQPSRQESTLYRVPFDNLRLVTGSVYVNKDEDEVMFILGGLDLKGLATLARVSRTLNGLVRPVIDAAKLWWRTNVVPRGLPNTITDYDRGMLGLFKVNSVDGFDLALAVAMDGRIIMNPLVHLGAGYTESQNTILSILLNPALTVTDIRDAAVGLKRLGPDYVDRAAKMYEEAAKDPRADLNDIQCSAAGLRSLGSAYNDRAAKLYELAIQHPEATNDDINTIFEKLGELGPKYKEEAIALWESLKGNK